MKNNLQIPLIVWGRNTSCRNIEEVSSSSIVTRLLYKSRTGHFSYQWPHNVDLGNVRVLWCLVVKELDDPSVNYETDSRLGGSVLPHPESNLGGRFPCHWRLVLSPRETTNNPNFSDKDPPPDPFLGPLRPDSTSGYGLLCIVRSASSWTGNRCVWTDTEGV